MTEPFAGLLRDRNFRWNEKFQHRPIFVPDDGELPVVTLPGGMTITLLSPNWERVDAMKKKWAAQLRDKPEGHPDHIEPGDWKKALEVLDEKRALQPDALGKDWKHDWDPNDFDHYAAAAFNEDTKEPNGSSIAFLAEFDDKAVLLTGDAFPSVLEESLLRLKNERGITGRIELSACKLPHHGSQNNISSGLIQLVKCKRWLVSTDGARHYHPHPSAIARVIEGAGGRPTLYFSHRSDENKIWDDDDLRDDRRYKTEYGPPEGGLRVVLSS